MISTTSQQIFEGFHTRAVSINVELSINVICLLSHSMQLSALSRTGNLVDCHFSFEQKNTTQQHHCTYISSTNISMNTQQLYIKEVSFDAGLSILSNKSFGLLSFCYLKNIQANNSVTQTSC